MIGDVCGKGAEAAAVTALARYTIRAAAVRRRSPAAILRWLNDAMLRQDDSTAGSARSPASTSTSRAGASAPRSPAAAIRRRCCCARATATVEEVGRRGTLLGLVADPLLEDRARELAPGDALVLYTDGITEARAPERVLDAGRPRAPRSRGAAGSRRSGSSSSSARSRWARRARRRATTSRSSRCARAASATRRLLDLAAPGAGLGAARLDQLLEAARGRPYAPLDQAELVAGLLHDPLGLRVELHHHARASRRRAGGR